jgi:hypothetical protein
MADIIRLERHRRPARTSGSEPLSASPAEIVLFMGVRYERSDLRPTEPGHRSPPKAGGSRKPRRARP